MNLAGPRVQKQPQEITKEGRGKSHTESAGIKGGKPSWERGEGGSPNIKVEGAHKNTSAQRGKRGDLLKGRGKWVNIGGGGKWAELDLSWEEYGHWERQGTRRFPLCPPRKGEGGISQKLHGRCRTGEEGAKVQGQGAY